MEINGVHSHKGWQKKTRKVVPLHLLKWNPMAGSNFSNKICNIKPPKK